MKKEEFPTFLNEQPVIIFGRSGRELLIMAIGLALSYLTWQHLSAFITGAQAATMLLKLILAVIPTIISIAVALLKIAEQPLEVWAFIWLFYFLLPKVFIYIPADESNMDDPDDTALALQYARNNQFDDDNGEERDEDY